VVIAFLELTSYINAGEAVDVEDEVVVVNSIVLPNKTLNVSVQEEIIL
jgi:mannose-1-phosphate guanylyltransferase